MPRPAVANRTSGSGGGWFSVFRGVQWSPAYVAFLVYVFVITTYRLPLGTESMLTALVLLPLERRPLRLPPPVMFALAFLAWAFVGWGTSSYPDAVWKQLNELAKICGVMFVAVNVLTTRERVRFFMLAFLGFFAFYPVRGALFSYFIYGGNVEGRAAWNYVYANPNDMASLCLLPLSFAAGMLMTERERWVRYCAIAGAVVLPFVILLTQSRGAFVALAVVALIILKGQKGRRGKIILLAGTATVVIAIAAPSSVWERLGTLTKVTSAESAATANDEGSARQRIEIWRVARTIFAENPVTGVGLGAYPYAHYVYAQRATFDRTALGRRDTHSTYLNLLAETGIVGFVLFFSMVAVSMREAELVRRRAKQSHPARAAQLFYMEVGLVGYFVAGIWGSYSMMVLTYLYLAVLYSTAHTLREELSVGNAATFHVRRSMRFGSPATRPRVTR
jgi:probable O-glycosylation ligase (exosortase A-associated)